jgi:hypothetical protein
MTVGHALLVARLELTNRWRSVLGRGTQLVGLAVAGVFLGLVFVAAVAAAYFVGQGIAAGDVTDPVPTARLVAGVVPLFVTLVTGLRVVQTSGSLTNADGLLTTVSHREAVGGVLLTELAVVAVVAGVPALAVPAAFAVGLGDPLAFLPVFGTLVALLVLGTLGGFAVGLGLRNLVARSELLARYKTAIGILLFIAYFVVVSSQAAGSAVAPVVDVVANSPLGWFGDLALLGVVEGPDPVRAGVAVGIGVGATVALLAVAEWLAAALWYASPVQPEEAASEASRMSAVGGLPRPMARIARKSWIRARRGPVRLIYVTYPLFALFPFLQEAVLTGTVTPVLPPLLVFYGAWASGAAFSLNPVGDEGPVLPVTLTTPVSGRAFVGGLCLAGLLLGVPITLLVAGATGVLSGLQPLALGAVVLTAVALPVAATGIAVGAGTLFPRMDEVEVWRGVETTAPSLFAFGLYSLVLGVAGIPATLVSTPDTRDLITDLAGVTETVAIAGGLAATLAVAGLAAVVGYRYAVGSFDDYYLG